MKCVIISIKPKWCELIANGKKTIEVRKTKPKLETPFKCYIYCTEARIPIKVNGNILMYEDDLALTNRYGQGKRVENPNGAIMNGEVLLNSKVIGEFVCDYIYENMSYDCEDSCVSVSDLKKYANGKPLYGWHISKLLIYDKPKELGDFTRLRETKFGYEPVKVERPPQSFYYVKGTIHCKNCKYLMFSDFYGECKKGYKGILNFDDFCDKGELR